MPTGKVKWFDAEKGFGFLSQEDGPDVYVRTEALPEGDHDPQGRAPGWSSASPRAAAVTRPSRSGSSTRPASVVAQPVARAPQEARGDGRDRRGPDPAARRRRRGLPPRPPPRRAARPSRRPSCCARWRTSSSSDRGPRRRRSARPRPFRWRRPGLTSTNSDQATSTAAAMPRPSRGFSGSAMPTKPPITQASWSVVSLRAKALVLHALGDVALDRGVERQLGQRLGQAGGEAEQRQRHHAVEQRRDQHHHRVGEQREHHGDRRVQLLAGPSRGRCRGRCRRRPRR